MCLDVVLSLCVCDLCCVRVGQFDVCSFALVHEIPLELGKKSLHRQYVRPSFPPSKHRLHWIAARTTDETLAGCLLVIILVQAIVGRVL